MGYRDRPGSTGRRPGYRYDKLHGWIGVTALGALGTAITYPDAVPMLFTAVLTLIGGGVVAVILVRRRRHGASYDDTARAKRGWPSRRLIPTFAVLGVLALLLGLSEWYGWWTGQPRDTGSAAIQFVLAALCAAIVGMVIWTKRRQHQ